MKNNEHPIVKRQTLDKLELHYCPRCEINMFLTNKEMITHLEKHQVNIDNGMESEFI